MVSAEWQSLVDAKRAARDALISESWRVPASISKKAVPESTVSAFDLLEESKLLTPKEKELTEKYDATALLEMLAAGTVSSVEVVTAFCKRAAIGQQLTNCLTEMFFEKAIDRARYLDDYLTREGKPIGPLHGLPVSLKDMLMVKGEYASLGFISYLKKPVAEENSVLTDIILGAGAVTYCKTNVPQTLFVCEGYNNVFGQTMNPYKLCLTPAGSSSGEGALVGFHGSPLGVGSDIGGSIRAPSLCNGTFGFKPTADRFPWAKQQELIPKGWPGIRPTLGPHAHSARDLTMFSRLIIQSRPWDLDSTALAVPWRDVPRKDRLTIGIWQNDKDFPVFPPIARVLESAASKLRAAGHEVKIFNEMVSLKEAVVTALRSFSLDTEQAVNQFLADAGEAPIVHLVEQAEVIAKLLPPSEVGLGDVWRVNREKEDLREQMAKVWREHKLDALLCPGARGTAMPHGKYGLPAWSVIWNLLDFPASIVPHLKADKEIDNQTMEGYDAAIVDGAPGSVQLVTPRFQDEECLMVTEVVAEALSK